MTPHKKKNTINTNKVLTGAKIQNLSNALSSLVITQL